MKTAKEKLAKAIELLREVDKDCDNFELVEYGSKLSFDELIAELESIEIRG